MRGCAVGDICTASHFVVNLITAVSGLRGWNKDERRSRRNPGIVTAVSSPSDAGQVVGVAGRSADGTAGRGGRIVHGLAEKRSQPFKSTTVCECGRPRPGESRRRPPAASNARTWPRVAAAIKRSVGDRAGEVERREGADRLRVVASGADKARANNGLSISRRRRRACTDDQLRERAGSARAVAATTAVGPPARGRLSTASVGSIAKR